MPTIQLTTEIRAPIERCFDLSRSIDLHRASVAHTGESAIAGVTSGLIGLDEEVTWRARHFGIWQELTSRITAYDRPHHFRDSMVRGAFAYFDHDHHFAARGDVTVMRDTFAYAAPLGPLGALAERLVLTRYLERFLRTRNRLLQHTAETDAWRNFLPP